MAQQQQNQLQIQMDITRSDIDGNKLKDENVIDVAQKD